MDEDFAAYLRVGTAGNGDPVTFTAADATLLRAVDEQGSLNRAAEALGRSYARAHERLGELEAATGDSLVERRRGGAGGGGSELTTAARELLARFDRLRDAFSGVAEAEETVVGGEVVARDGELATVETDAGRVRALVSGVPTGARVALTVRADSVTLHAPDDAPAPDATSARNRFSGAVRDVDRGESVALVAVDLGGPTLLALVTVDSVERLGLAPGVPVVATFKATATRGTPESG